MHALAAQGGGIGQGLVDEAAAEFVHPVGQAGQATLARRPVTGWRVEQRLLQAVVGQAAGELRRITEYFSTDNNPKLVRYEVRYYSLLFETIGPLIIIAISIPFAVSGVRVSPAVGVSKSIGLFFLYYVLTNLSDVLGGRGYLDPVWAALMPNLTMVGLAAYFFGRMR